jgi:hypothetical protein
LAAQRSQAFQGASAFAVDSPARVTHDLFMAANVTVHIDLEMPTDLARLRLPEGLDRRLRVLLDKQDQGHALTDDERAEAEGIVELADLLTLLRLRAANDTPDSTPPTR